MSYLDLWRAELEQKKSLQIVKFKGVGLVVLAEVRNFKKSYFKINTQQLEMQVFQNLFFGKI